MCAAKVTNHGQPDKPLTCPRCRHRFDARVEAAPVEKGLQKKTGADSAAKLRSAPPKTLSGVATRKPKKKNSLQAKLRLWLFRFIGVLALILISFGIFRLVQLALGELRTLDDVSGTYINEDDPEQYLVIDARGVCKFKRIANGQLVEGSVTQLAYKLRGNTLYLSLLAGFEDVRAESIDRPKEMLSKTPFLTVQGSALASRKHGRFLRVDLDCITPSGGIRPGPVKYGELRSPRSANGRTMARPVNPRLRAATEWTAVSADGSVFVTGQQNGCIGVWDPNTGEPIAGWESNFESVLHPGLSPDGDRLAFVCGAHLRVMNPRTGEFLSEPVSLRGVQQDSASSSALAYTVDGENLLVNSSQGMKIMDGELRTEGQNLEMGRVGPFVLLTEGNTCLALCGSRETVVARSTLAWCDLDTRSDERTLELPGGREYERVALSADGKTLALFGYIGEKRRDRSLGKGFIQLRRSSDGELLGELEVTSNLGPFGFTNHDRSLIVVERSGLSEWDVGSATLIHRRHEFPVAFFGQVSQAANRLMTVTGRPDGGGPRFFDLTTAKEIGIAE